MLDSVKMTQFRRQVKHYILQRVVEQIKISPIFGGRPNLRFLVKILTFGYGYTMPSDNIQHDAAYKAFFSDPAMVRSLLQDFVPHDIIRDFDLNTLEQCSGSYTTINLSQRHDDLVWRLRFKGEWCYIYILLEFQSTQDHWMALRILNYMTLLWQDLLKKGLLEKDKKLPPIFPMVIYNGEQDWSAPINIYELVESVSDELAAYQPRQKYFLLDEKRISDFLLENAQGESAYIFRLERAQTIQDMRDLLDELLARISTEHQDILRRNIFSWLGQLAVKKGSGSQTRKTTPIEDRNMLEQRFREWEQDFIQKGILQGKAEGIAQGKAEGMAQGKAEGILQGKAEGILEGKKSTLLDMLYDRFGTIPENWRLAISQIADAEILSQLIRSVYKVKSQNDYGEILRGTDKPQ